jgi:putative ABC transport system permease protein
LVPGYTTNLGPDGDGYVGPNVWFIRFRPGVDTETALAKLRHEAAPIARDPGALKQLRAQRPAEIVNAAEIGSSPKLLAGALGIAAFASLAFALATSVRRRRIDFAILKTLGFTRSQLAATVRWQAGSTMVIGLLIGVPTGVVVGAVMWRKFAETLDVVPQASTPFWAIAVIGIVAMIVALVAAAVPARAARRVKPARLLRSIRG